MKLGLFGLMMMTSLSFAQSDLEKGIQLQEKFQFLDAKAVFETILTNDPNNAEANCRLGKLYLLYFENYNKAIEYCEKAVESNGQSSEYHYWLGRSYALKAASSMPNIFNAFRYARKMKSEHEKAIELDPRNFESRVQLLLFYLRAPGIMGGGRDKARTLAQETIAIDQAVGRGMMAVIFIDEDNSEQAGEEIKKAISLGLRNGELCNQFGYFYLKRKRYDEAISQFKKYIELDPNDPNGYDSLGDGYFASGQYDEAISEYMKAIGLNPKYVPSIYHLGKTNEKKGQKSEALKYYKLCIELDSKGRFSDKTRERIKALSQN